MKNSWVKLLCFICLVNAGQAFAVEAFFAPPVPQGSIEVQLHATNAVVLNTPTVASFGVPFPRGSITTVGLNSLRVLDNGNEIAAYVIELTPWRHRTNVSLDAQSVRIALVQVEVSFSNLAASKLLTLEWGLTARTLSRPTRALRASTWHTVTSGSFVATDDIMEPNIYAVLPATWLSHGVLRANRALSFDPTNLEPRDNPVTNDAIATWPNYQESERAFKNDFYSVINADDPLVTIANQCPYKTGFEPWLYDRAATMFALHFRSGYLSALREAIRHTDFYRARINLNGQFALDPTDNKYSFNESLAYAYWMTGDATFLPPIISTANAHSGSPHAWNAGLGFWTERMAAFKLMAFAIDYEVNGNVGRRGEVNNIVSALLTHQNATDPAMPVAGRVEGGFYHTGNQHGDWDGAAYGGSSWMTALLSDALRRAYLTNEDNNTATLMRRIGSFLHASLRNEAGSFGTDTAPRYVVEYDGSDFTIEDPLHDEEHALDVLSAIAWADYFGALQNQRNPQLVADINQLYATYDLGVNYWIRPAAPASGLTAYRVNPWRKWGWQHRTSDGFSWAIQAANAPDPGTIFFNGFEN